MSFTKLSKQVTVEVGKSKSILKFRPLGPEAIQGLLSKVDTDDMNNTKPSDVSEIMSDHIIEMEGIDDKITSDFLIQSIPLVEFYGCLAEMVKSSVKSESQSKNSDSLSESPTEAAGEPTNIAE